MTSIIEMNSTAEITDQINFDKKNEQIQPDSPASVAEIITNITSSFIKFKTIFICAR